MCGNDADTLMKNKRYSIQPEAAYTGNIRLEQQEGSAKGYSAANGGPAELGPIEKLDNEITFKVRYNGPMVKGAKPDCLRVLPVHDNLTSDGEISTPLCFHAGQVTHLHFERYPTKMGAYVGFKESEVHAYDTYGHLVDWTREKIIIEPLGFDPLDPENAI